MYQNLNEILFRKGVSNKKLAEMLNITEKTLWNKLNGQTEFSLREALIICSTICPEYRMEYVFRNFADFDSTRSA